MKRAGVHLPRAVGVRGADAGAQGAGAVGLGVAAPDRARGLSYGPAQLGAVHLVGLGFLTVAVAGALQHSAAQVALSVSGIAGPDGGTADKPVGTVWFAWGSKNGETRAKRYQLSGNRAEVRAQAVRIALQGVINLLNRWTETA